MKRLLLVPALWAALALPAGAQCVMCYRTAHAQNEARSRVLDMGIVLLGAPPFLILAGFIAYVFSRDQAVSPDATPEGDRWMPPAAPEETTPEDQFRAELPR